MNAQGERIPFYSLHASTRHETQIPGIFEDSQRLAREALRQMDSMIRHGDIGVPESATHMVIDPKWLDGMEASFVP